jgi:hypothetical protein
MIIYRFISLINDELTNTVYRTAQHLSDPIQRDQCLHYLAVNL